MGHRAVRFKQRQALRKKLGSRRHLQEVADRNLVADFINSKINSEQIERIQHRQADYFKLQYDLSVSADEVKNALEIIDKEFNRQKYDILFESSKEVVIDQLLKPFGLSRAQLATQDQDGGFVQTIHNAKKDVYVDDSYEYNRKEYIKSSKSVGGTSDAFNTVRKKALCSATDKNGNVKDVYTGEVTYANNVDLDHVESLKDFHNNGGFMLSAAEKRQFAADEGNHAFTNKSINRSKGAKSIEQHSKEKGLDKRRTNAASNRAKKTSEKYITPNEKIKFHTTKMANAGLEQGNQQGLQQSLSVLISEFVTAIYHEVRDVISNGWENGHYDLSWVEALKHRFLNVKTKVLSKWKNVVTAYKDGAISGFFSTIITSVLNMFITTGKNIVRILREGFLSLFKALKTLFFPPEGMTLKQAAHAASKVFAGGAVISISILAEETISKAIATSLPILAPFVSIIGPAISGMIAGLGSLLVVYMLDKLDLFGVVAEERHLFIMGALESRIDAHIDEAEGIIQRLGLETI